MIGVRILVCVYLAEFTGLFIKPVNFVSFFCVGSLKGKIFIYNFILFDVLK